MRRLLQLMTVAGLVALTAGACGEDNEELEARQPGSDTTGDADTTGGTDIAPDDRPPASGDTETTSRVPGPDEGTDHGPFPDHPQVKVAAGDTVDPSPRPFESYSVEGDQVRVYWWGGVEPCAVLDRVEVDETSDAVIVTLHEGPDRTAVEESGEEGPICIAVAASFVSEPVSLGDELGARDVIDGSTGDPVPLHTNG